MNAIALENIGAGFSDEAMGSQQVFRAVLRALSRPGEAVELIHDAQVGSQGHASSAGVLLALLDPDCRVWFSASLRSTDVPVWLRFHTGCEVVTDASVAHFLWFHQDDPLLNFSGLANGTDSYPDQSATVIVDIATASAQPDDCPALSLSGPGIETSVSLAVPGLSSASFEVLLEGLSGNATRFPRGVDVLLAGPTQITGLARSTLVTMKREA